MEKLPFWKTKTLEQMNPEEWESLCDGCAWCCLFKIEDEDTRELFYTCVACKYLNLKTCRCTEYGDRTTLVPTCLQITPQLARELTWMPETCAYRRLALDLDLPEWHPLVTGDAKSTHKSGHSVGPMALSEYGVDMDSLEDYLLDDDGVEEIEV